MLSKRLSPFSVIQGVKELEHLNETGELKILLQNFEVGSSMLLVSCIMISAVCLSKHIV